MVGLFGWVKEANVRNLLFVFVLLLSTSSLAIAGLTSGNQLKGYLDDLDNNESSASFNAGVYSGYVIGVHDTFNGVLYCASSEATNGQIRAAVTKYIKANPEAWDKPAHVIVP